MSIMQSITKSNNIPKQPNTERRSFLWKIGAAMSAVLASAVPGKSNPGINQDMGLNNQIDGQLGILDDENAIRRLHHTYENFLNAGRYEKVVNLFADGGEVVFNGGIFKGKSRGVLRLYNERFKPGFSGKKIEPAPGFPPDAEQQPDIVRVAANRKTAIARFFYSIQVGTPIISDSQLVKMARLHGEGIMKWWEGGIYNVSYVKDIKGKKWKIKRLEYKTLSKADYKPGRSYAKPIDIPVFSKVYPKDPAGPDKLC